MLSVPEITLRIARRCSIILLRFDSFHLCMLGAFRSVYCAHKHVCCVISLVLVFHFSAMQIAIFESVFKIRFLLLPTAHHAASMQGYIT